MNFRTMTFNNAETHGEAVLGRLADAEMERAAAVEHATRFLYCARNLPDLGPMPIVADVAAFTQRLIL